MPQSPTVHGFSIIVQKNIASSQPSNLHPFDSFVLLFTAPVSFGHFPHRNRIKLKLMSELIEYVTRTARNGAFKYEPKFSIEVPRPDLKTRSRHKLRTIS